MKLFPVLMACSLLLFANERYKISKENYEEYGEKGEITKIVDTNSDKTLLSFLTYEKSGECGKRDYQEAIYDLNDSLITIYTKWRGYDLKGYRVMRYDLSTSLYATPIFSKIYIEDRSYEDGDRDIKLLQDGAKTEKEKEILEEYVRSCEKSFKGKFQFSKEKEKLILEVNKAFRKDMKNRWAL